MLYLRTFYLRSSVTVTEGTELAVIKQEPATSDTEEMSASDVAGASKDATGAVVKG